MIEGRRPASALVLPAEVATVVSSLHDGVLARVGDVARSRRLHLDEPDDLDVLVAACRGETDLPRFDAVISIVALPRFADVDEVARAVHGLLEPGGVVHLVEPVAHIGATARFRATLWAGNPKAQGHHLERDIPFAFRSNDLLITDLERITMPTRSWPLCRFIDARARREAPFGSLPGDLAPRSDVQAAPAQGVRA